MRRYSGKESCPVDDDGQHDGPDDSIDDDGDGIDDEDGDNDNDEDDESVVDNDEENKLDAELDLESQDNIKRYHSLLGLY